MFEHVHGHQNMDTFHSDLKTIQKSHKSSNMPMSGHFHSHRMQNIMRHTKKTYMKPATKTRGTTTPKKHKMMRIRFIHRGKQCGQRQYFGVYIAPGQPKMFHHSK